MNNDGKISGFYYDNQLENPLTSMSLYPNQIITLDEDGKKKWSNVSDPDEEELPNGNKFDKESSNLYYSKTPLLSSVLVDDFQIDIANNWGDAGGDAMGSMWNSFKGISPYINKLGKLFSTISNKTNKYAEDNKLHLDQQKSDIAEKIGQTSNLFSQIAKESTKLMNRGLSVQGSQFSYFGGSGINFNNLGVKFTIFPSFKQGKMETVVDKVLKIIPYCIGPFIPVNLAEDFNYGDPNSEFNKLAGEYVHWQLPPGGFEANTKYIDFVQKGTLKLVIGSYYAIQNLVITGCGMVFSKQMMKNPFINSISDTNYLTPMYCDVNIMLKPVTKYSRSTLEDVISGKYTNKLRKTLCENMLNSYNKSEQYYNYKDTSNYV